MRAIARFLLLLALSPLILLLLPLGVITALVLHCFGTKLSGRNEMMKDF